MGAWAPKKDFPLGAAVAVVGFQNVSDQEVIMSLWTFEPVVTDQDGRVPYMRRERRRLGLDPEHPRFGSQSLKRLQPGEIVWSVYTLGLGFDLSVAGEYTFELNYVYSDKNTHTTTVATAPPVALHVGDQDLTTSMAVMQCETIPDVRKNGASATAGWLSRGVAALGEAARNDEDRQVRAAAQAHLRRLSDELKAALEEQTQ